MVPEGWSQSAYNHCCPGLAGVLLREQVISRFTARPWPANSPNLSVLDYWFWSVCLSELRRFPPNTLEELKEKGEILADSLEEEEVSGAV